MAADKYSCKACHKNITASGVPQLRYRKHDAGKGEECANSRSIVPHWIVKRGPETGPEDDRPVIGRDYAQCPDCERSPLLDDDGKFALHIREPGVPSAERVNCPMSGRPYTPEGEECPTVPTPEASADSAPATPPTSPSEPTASPTSGESPAASTAPASTATDARPAASPAPVSEAEQLLSTWATKVREIEDRNLPETDPSPASTPTPQALPPRPDAPEAPPTLASPVASTPRTASTESATAQKPTEGEAPPAVTAMEDAAVPVAALPEPQSSAADAAGAGAASTSTAPTGGPPPDIEALVQLFPKSARTPGSTSTGSAAPVPAAAPAVPDAVSIPTASPPAAPAAAVPADLVLTGHSCSMGGSPDLNGHTVDCVLTLQEREPGTSPFAQPGSPFSQPAKLPAAVTDPIPMTVLGEQVAARMKELFFSYGNRKTGDNRSAQVTLGPSGIGSPCDRRIAMSLLRIPAVNPGGDGWAAFKGTAIHAALAELFTWASADTGRFAVEVPLRFPSEHVPGGTTDLLDRVLFMVDDHKIQSRWSQDRLRVDGMTATQRVQLHTYGFGARLQGEVVDHVALISWPMEASSLDDLYVVVEPYDPQIARDALARVDRIAAEVKERSEPLHPDGAWSAARPLEVARAFDVADDCKFCEWYAPGDPDMKRGCPGR